MEIILTIHEIAVSITIQMALQNKTSKNVYYMYENIYTCDGKLSTKTGALMTNIRTPNLQTARLHLIFA